MYIFSIVKSKMTIYLQKTTQEKTTYNISTDLKLAKKTMNVIENFEKKHVKTGDPKRSQFSFLFSIQ